MELDYETQQFGRSGRALWEQLSLGIDEDDSLAILRVVHICRQADRCDRLHDLTDENDGLGDPPTAAMFKEATNAAVVFIRLLNEAKDIVEAAVANGANLKLPLRHARSQARKLGVASSKITTLDRFRKAANK